MQFYQVLIRTLLSIKKKRKPVCLDRSLHLFLMIFPILLVIKSLRKYSSSDDLPCVSNNLHTKSGRHVKFPQRLISEIR